MQSPQDLEPQLQRQGWVATITLSRPAKMNRLSPHDLTVLQRLCDELATDASVRVVVLTASTAGQKRPVFCAGYNVEGFADPNHDPRLFEDAVEAVARLPQVVVAVVNGSVYGGATDLVLACDLRLGLEGAEFRMPACALGFHYYPSGLRRYVQVLGVDGAKLAFLTASVIPFDRLRELGAFVSLHPMQEIDAAGQALAERVAQLGPLAVQATKQSLNEIGGGHANTHTLLAREAQTLASKDFAEGRRAFAERREPRFNGS
jgi:enoyl-CoA hydratase/carnithine racemase